MKNLILFLSLITLFSLDLKSSHNPGGDVRIEQIGANQFILHYRLLSEWLPTPSSIGTNIYDNVTDTLVLTITINRDSILHYINGNDTVGINFYSDTLTLQNNPNGYYTTHSICCRTAVLNTNNDGIVYTCMFPDPAIFGRNSNPNFTESPGRVNMCVNQSKTLDFSCIDSDGDSLVYSLINPYAFTATGGKKPFTFVSYNLGFSLSNI